MNGKKVSLWWGPPRDFSERKHERKISWLELFYDLAYVAAISQLTHHMAEHPSWNTAGFSLLLFCLVFWSWVNGSQYYDLHGSDSIRTRLLTFFQVMAVAGVAITLPDAFEGHYRGFACAFSVLQILITYLWWSVGFYDPSHRVFNKYYTFNYLIAFTLLIVSAFAGAGVAILLWTAVLVLDLTPSLIGARTIVAVLKERGQVFSASATLVERFGLFTIIVLTESILGTVTGLSEIRQRTPAAWLAAFLAISIAFLLWSLYFDMTSEQETKKGYAYLQWLVFLHFPLLASLSVVGASLKVLLVNQGSGIPVTVAWMFCASIATILFTIVALTRVMEEEEEDRAYIRPVSKLLLVAGAAVLAVPLCRDFLNAIGFLSLISALLFVPVAIGIQSWVRYKFFSAG